MIPIHHAQCVLIVSSRAFFSHLDKKKKCLQIIEKKAGKGVSRTVHTYT